MSSGIFSFNPFALNWMMVSCDGSCVCFVVMLFDVGGGGVGGFVVL